MKGQYDKIELAVYLKHDANITLFSQGKMLHYIELEKVTQNRYQAFALDQEKFAAQWSDWVMPYLVGFTFDTIHWNWATAEQLTVLKRFFPDCQNWVKHTHHLSHAWSIYNFTRPKERDIIVSVDGRGDLGDSFNVYEYLDGSIKLVRELKLRLGVGYRLLGILSPEIESDRSFEFDCNHSVPGKAMALAGYGKIREEWVNAIRDYYIRFREFAHPSLNISNLQQVIGIHGVPVDVQASRDLLATSQKVFEDIFIENISDLICSPNTGRLLLAGGCALNVTLNSKISSLFRMEVFISPVPGDCGLSLGMFRASHPEAPLINAFKGIEFNGLQTERSYKLYPRQAGLGILANMLAEGKIIGVIYGDCELGPRALGHRSLLANPFIPGIRDKLNKIKRREFYRPVSPIMPLALCNEIFCEPSPSPFMSFAPRVRSNYKELLAEVTHIDGTARVQTVDESDKFIFDLLKEFGKLVELPVLANTSLNLKGKPLVNDLDAAMNLLLETEMDFLWINGLLYEKENAGI